MVLPIFTLLVYCSFLLIVNLVPDKSSVFLHDVDLVLNEIDLFFEETYPAQLSQTPSKTSSSSSSMLSPSLAASTTGNSANETHSPVTAPPSASNVSLLDNLSFSSPPLRHSPPSSRKPLFETPAKNQPLFETPTKNQSKSFVQTGLSFNRKPPVEISDGRRKLVDNDDEGELADTTLINENENDEEAFISFTEKEWSEGHKGFDNVLFGKVHAQQQPQQQQDHQQRPMKTPMSNNVSKKRKSTEKGQATLLNYFSPDKTNPKKSIASPSVSSIVPKKPQPVITETGKPKQLIIETMKASISVSVSLEKIRIDFPAIKKSMVDAIDNKVYPTNKKEIFVIGKCDDLYWCCQVFDSCYLFNFERLVQAVIRHFLLDSYALAARDAEEEIVFDSRYAEIFFLRSLSAFFIFFILLLYTI